MGVYFIGIYQSKKSTIYIIIIIIIIMIIMVRIIG